jgi:hypothetical protein
MAAEFHDKRHPEERPEMRRNRRSNRLQITSEDPRFFEEIDDRIKRMRELLAAMATEKSTAAFGSMRKAVPASPLSDRVRAVTGRQR